MTGIDSSDIDIESKTPTFTFFYQSYIFPRFTIHYGSKAEEHDDPVVLLNQRLLPFTGRAAVAETAIYQDTTAEDQGNQGNNSRTSHVSSSFRRTVTG